jgi:hypothetical protein
MDSKTNFIHIPKECKTISPREFWLNNPLGVVKFGIVVDSHPLVKNTVKVFRDGGFVFNGIIKNKSELKKVLKMIGYEQG